MRDRNTQTEFGRSIVDTAAGARAELLENETAGFVEFPVAEAIN